MSDGLTINTNSMNEQSTAMNGETGVTVRHRRPPGCEAANSTMSGGLHASADVTNVTAEYI
jgi:hypothetical protein